MEVEGAKTIFYRSLQNGGGRYLTYLGDGDSKDHETVNEIEPYGPDVIIETAEYYRIQYIVNRYILERNGLQEMETDRFRDRQFAGLSC